MSTSQGQLRVTKLETQLERQGCDVLDMCRGRSVDIWTMDVAIPLSSLPTLIRTSDRERMNGMMQQENYREVLGCSEGGPAAGGCDRRGYWG